MRQSDLFQKMKAPLLAIWNWREWLSYFAAVCCSHCFIKWMVRQTDKDDFWRNWVQASIFSGTKNIEKEIEWRSVEEGEEGRRRKSFYKSRSRGACHSVFGVPTAPTPHTPMQIARPKENWTRAYSQSQAYKEETWNRFNLLLFPI